ncbi:hypothetical protein [Thiocapsa bogorovii]|uniref:hypothetical protein n=1 Tax=Thiocapsa bogorovii TaxID=521689 RepID=UPI001E2E2599|nr:hypothetical protein [Thiocapsa bogorovii]UHD14706.1 hypothetical protein LT988_15600 [Thiocapsa bogorovii]
MRKHWWLLTASWLAVAAGSAVLWQGTREAMAAPVGETPAVACRAASLALAQNLRWDHVRVWNQAAFPVWVVCPVTNNTEVWYNSADDTLEWYGPGSASLSVWFDSTAAPGASVLCTYLDIEPDIVDTSVTNFVSHTINAPASLPGVTSQTFDLSLFNGFDASTITCRLDPSTGLNTYRVFYSKPVI